MLKHYNYGCTTSSLQAIIIVDQEMSNCRDTPTMMHKYCLQFSAKSACIVRSADATGKMVIPYQQTEVFFVMGWRNTNINFPCKRTKSACNFDTQCAAHVVGIEQCACPYMHWFFTFLEGDHCLYQGKIYEVRETYNWLIWNRVHWSKVSIGVSPYRSMTFNWIE